MKLPDPNGEKALKPANLKLLEREQQPIEPEIEESKVDETKAEQRTAGDTKTEEPKAEDTKTEEPKVEDTKTEEPKIEDTNSEELHKEEFPLQSLVEAHSLKTAALNGQRGKVSGWKGERIMVEFPEPIGKKSLKPVNLKPVEDEAAGGNTAEGEAGADDIPMDP